MRNPQDYVLPSTSRYSRIPYDLTTVVDAISDAVRADKQPPIAVLPSLEVHKKALEA